MTPGVDRNRQDRLRGAGRSAGDDRHLRLRDRPVAPALWPDHRLGAARPPDDGNLASARRHGRDQRIQFSGRGVGLERGPRAGVRQPGHLEAVGENSAHRARGAGDLRAHRGRVRARTGHTGARPAARADRRSGAGRGAGRPPAGGAAVRDRVHRDGASAGTGRQQRRHRVPARRPGTAAARHRVRRHGNGRPALHHAAAPVRAPRSGRGFRGAPGARGSHGASRRPAAGRNAGRSPDRRGRLSGDAVGSGRGRQGRRSGSRR